ncbi:FAD-binding protein [Corynebacterium camporealensis]|uniref:FAD-binding protein n=1 Tax=Corynebacterium camporealensis TaxID=161896 RepID=UPI0020124228|nr:FAD-binding protein [Corynebacterium camporealensis]
MPPASACDAPFPGFRQPRGAVPHRTHRPRLFLVHSQPGDCDKEFIFSGSEQNSDLTDKEIKKLLGKIGPGTPVAIKAFQENGVDWVTANSVQDLVKGMNEVGDVEIDASFVERQLLERDAQLSNSFSKDIQVNYIRMARQFLGDKIVRVHPPHRILDESKGPLIAVRLHILTRKTLGGIEN